MIDDISPREFTRRRENNAHWQLIDVREAWEVDTVSVGGAMHIPMGEIPARHAELDKSRPLAVLCHSGGRSRQVAEFLATQGFEEIANIAGGIDAWALDVDQTLPRY